MRVDRIIARYKAKKFNTYLKEEAKKQWGMDMYRKGLRDGMFFENSRITNAAKGLTYEL